MQLTQFTDYSLRTLIYIGTNEQTSTIKDIAAAYSISRNHLIKIIQCLSKIGIIKTLRGKNGGVEMAIAPDEINLKTLILKLEPNFDLVPCFNPNKPACCIAPVCKLKRILHEAQNAFLSVLEQFTLADLMYNPMKLQELIKQNQRM